MPEVSEDIGHAASTGATDGKLFFAIFSTGDLVAVDMNGSIAWTRSFGIPKCDYGYASSLIAYKHLFVQIDDKNGANLYALDPVTGKTVWRKTRTLRAVMGVADHRHLRRSRDGCACRKPDGRRVRCEHRRGGSLRSSACLAK
jgi:outer membrane protein assembly factor BamB